MVGVEVTRNNSGKIGEPDVIQEGGCGVFAVVVDVDKEHGEATRGGNLEDEDIGVFNQV